MMWACEQATDKFLPTSCPKSLSGRLRVLLTRVGFRPPFVTGEVVEQFETWQDAWKVLRASCHVPFLGQILPYRWRDRHYYDGLMWASLLVPWSGDDLNLVVKVSATASPTSEIRAPFHPMWWGIVPPKTEVMRGMFWTGYLNAAQWFSE